MTCAEVVLRLYDEDCRECLRAGQPPPADLSGHLTSCGACRAEWRQAAEDALALRAAFEEELPAPLRAVLYGICSQQRPRAWLRHLPALADAIAAGAGAALAAGLAGSASSQMQFAVFASALLALAACVRARSAGLDLPARRLLAAAAWLSTGSHLRFGLARPSHLHRRGHWRRSARCPPRS